VPLDPEKEKQFKKILEDVGLGGREEAIAKAITKLTDEEKLEFFSFLTPGEDDSIALMYSIADRYDLEWLKIYVVKKLKLRTSVGGWRAKQIVDIAAEKRKVDQGFSFLGMFKRKKKDKGLGDMEEFE